MSMKIGTPEWIENVTQKALNNRANQLNPNNIRCSAKPAREALCQGVTAVEYGFLAAGIAAGIAIAGVAAYAYKHFTTKKKDEEVQAEDGPEPIMIESVETAAECA